MDLQEKGYDILVWIHLAQDWVL